MPIEANSSKKYTYIWVSAVILVFGIIFVPRIVERLKGQTVVVADRMSGYGTQNDLSYIFIGGERRKVPEFEFLNQDSVLISNKDYLGKVYVVDFFFTSCPTICPIMTKNLVSIQDSFKGENDLAMASFTITPKYDTPSKLKRYAERYHVTHENWHFLTGGQDSIYNLARNGFNVLVEEVPNAPGGFEHSGIFALVDKEGYIRSRRDEFGNPIIYYRGNILESDEVNEDGEVQQITSLKEDIKKLLKE